MALHAVPLLVLVSACLCMASVVGCPLELGPLVCIFREVSCFCRCAFSQGMSGRNASLVLMFQLFVSNLWSLSIIAQPAVVSTAPGCYAAVDQGSGPCCIVPLLTTACSWPDQPARSLHCCSISFKQLHSMAQMQALHHS